jgi:hypothetical protein
MVRVDELTPDELGLLFGAGIDATRVVVMDRSAVDAILYVLRKNVKTAAAGRVYVPKMKEVRCPHGHLAHLSIMDKSNGCLLCGRHDIEVKKRPAPHVHPHPLPWDVGYRGEWERGQAD